MDSWQAIHNLLQEYAFRLDAGDLEGFAELFRDGTWNGNVGHAETLAWLRRYVILYDGQTYTHHVITNVQVMVDPSDRTATGRCYMTILQKAPQDAVVQVITSNAYEFEFDRIGDAWRFTHCAIPRKLRGDTSKHRSGPPGW